MWLEEDAENAERGAVRAEEDALGEERWAEDGNKGVAEANGDGESCNRFAGSGNEEAERFEEDALPLTPLLFLCDGVADLRKELGLQDVLRALGRTGDLMDAEEPGAMVDVAQYHRLCAIQLIDHCDGTMSTVHMIELGDGSSVSAMQAAENAVDAWKTIFRDNALPFFADPHELTNGSV